MFWPPLPGEYFKCYITSSIPCKVDDHLDDSRITCDNVTDLVYFRPATSRTPPS